MAAEPEVVKEALPTQAGTFSGYLPQWKHDPTWGVALNKRVGFGEGGEDWTDIPVTIFRGGVAMRLPDGREVPVGIPFPRRCPGVLETINMYGYEQAMALSWSYAAHADAVGATIKVRVKEYRVHYDIKCYAVAEHSRDDIQERT